MEKPDGSFLKYALSKTKDPHILEWLEGIAGEFRCKPICGHCFGVDVEIIVDLKVVKRCRACGNFSSNIDIDKIQPTDYNAVTFLHEEKIIDILRAQGIRIN
jgi:hypothetical protein